MKARATLANFSLSCAIIYLQKRFKAGTCGALGAGVTEFIIPLKNINFTNSVASLFFFRERERQR